MRPLMENESIVKALMKIIGILILIFLAGSYSCTRPFVAFDNHSKVKLLRSKQGIYLSASVIYDATPIRKEPNEQKPPSGYATFGETFHVSKQLYEGGYRLLVSHISLGKEEAFKQIGYIKNASLLLDASTALDGVKGAKLKAVMHKRPLIQSFGEKAPFYGRPSEQSKIVGRAYISLPFFVYRKHCYSVNMKAAVSPRFCEKNIHSGTYNAMYLLAYSSRMGAECILKERRKKGQSIYAQNVCLAGWAKGGRLFLWPTKLAVRLQKDNLDTTLLRYAQRIAKDPRKKARFLRPRRKGKRAPVLIFSTLGQLNESLSGESPSIQSIEVRNAKIGEEMAYWPVIEQPIDINLLQPTKEHRLLSVRPLPQVMKVGYMPYKVHAMNRFQPLKGFLLTHDPHSGERAFETVVLMEFGALGRLVAFLEVFIEAANACLASEKPTEFTHRFHSLLSQKGRGLHYGINENASQASPAEILQTITGMPPLHGGLFAHSPSGLNRLFKRKKSHGYLQRQLQKLTNQKEMLSHLSLQHDIRYEVGKNDEDDDFDIRLTGLRYQNGWCDMRGAGPSGCNALGGLALVDRTLPTAPFAKRQLWIPKEVLP